MQVDRRRVFGFSLVARSTRVSGWTERSNGCLEHNSNLFQLVRCSNISNGPQIRFAGKQISSILQAFCRSKLRLIVHQQRISSRPLLQIYSNFSFESNSRSRDSGAQNFRVRKDSGESRSLRIADPWRRKFSNETLRDPLEIGQRSLKEFSLKGLICMSILLKSAPAVHNLCSSNGRLPHVHLAVDWVETLVPVLTCLPTRQPSCSLTNCEM